MTIAVLRNVEKEDVPLILQEIEKSLQGPSSEVVIDFSFVTRLDEGALRSLTQFADKAEEASIKVKLRGVKVDVYKVLVLMKLNSRFVFLN